MSMTETGKTEQMAGAENSITGDHDPGGAPGASEETDDGDQRGWIDNLKSKLGLPSRLTLREKFLDELNDDDATRGVFSAQERDMLNRILRIGGLRVEDVMVPRADIVAIDETAEIKDLLDLFREAGHSRLPVFQETLDDARGMIHIKDLVVWLMGDENGEAHKGGNGKKTNGRAGKSDEGGKSKSERGAGTGRSYFESDLSQPILNARIRRPVLFVPPSMPAMNLFSRMQSTRIHLALVVDEYGGTDGLVSIEDLLEEVVGEIEDEHDDQNTDLITDDPVRGLVASARAPVEELEAIINIDLMPDEDDEDIDTLGGLVFSLVGRVPVCGELVPHPKGIEFEVLEANSRQIKRLRIHRRKAALENSK